MSRPATLVLALMMMLSVGACSSGDQQGEQEWVAGLRPGDCVDPGNRASAAVVRMRVVPCRERHAMEVYARLPYPPVATASATPTPSDPDDLDDLDDAEDAEDADAPPWKVPTPTPTVATSSSSEYPGRDVLRTFAREACAEHFRAYLGTNTREPWYFLTYLFPSVGSWTAASEQRPKLGPLARLITSAVRSDRSVVCFVRTTGPVLTASVRGPRTAPTTSPAPATTGPTSAASEPAGATGSAS